VEEELKDLMEQDTVTVAPYAQPNGVNLRVTARAETTEQAQRMIDPVVGEIRTRLGDFIFGSVDQSLECAIIEMMAARELTVSVAESMTGGQLAAALSAEPGSGVVFPGGVTCYSVPAKKTFLGLEADLIDRHGPVSAEVAE